MTTANKKAYVRPMMICEQFTPNEYVAACWGVGCTVDDANLYEQTHYYKNTWWEKTTWADLGCSHAAAHCGASGNQVIYDTNNDGIADKMTEIGTDGLGTLNCVIYTNGDYSAARNISSVKTGEKIYWTTTSGKRVWHHVGTVFPSVPGHPNRS